MQIPCACEKTKKQINKYIYIYIYVVGTFRYNVAFFVSGRFPEKIVRSGVDR